MFNASLADAQPALVFLKEITSPNYRSDIDGLRAVAVLSVIGFHAFPSWVAGGFIGVDIFFVISGFLISNLIQEHIQQKSFTLRAFYAGRVRRLFPALILIMLACQVFAWFALLSDEYKSMGKHIAASSVFIPNLIFWNESGYFDYAASAKPLLHLWSLGIEWQFYMLWPIMIWLAYRFRASFLGVGITLLLGSLAINLTQIEYAPSATFFSPLTRMWELLSGCVLACFLKTESNLASSFREQCLKHVWVKPTVSLAATVLLLAGVFLFDDELRFPGVWALVPVTATMLIIACGQQGFVNQKLLSSRVLVGVGLISYPLYLWHWPLLSFAKIMGGSKPDWLLCLGLILLSWVLALATFHFIERPIRVSPFSRQKTYALITAMVLTGGIGWTTFQMDGFSSRIANKEIASQLADLKFDLPDSKLWYCKDVDADGPRCHANNPSSSTVVMGDSHALMIYSGLQEYFEAKGQTIGLYGASDGCPALLNVVSQDAGGNFRNCLIKGSKAIQRVLTDPDVKEVILTSRGPMYTTGEGFGEIEWAQFGTWKLNFEGEAPDQRSNTDVFAIGLATTLDKLISSGKKVTYLHDVAELGFDIQSCFHFRPLSFHRTVTSPCAVSRGDFEIRVKNHRAMVDQVLNDRPQIKVIDLALALCDEQWCYGGKDGVLFYIDDDHLSRRGASYVIQKLKNKF